MKIQERISNTLAENKPPLVTKVKLSVSTRYISARAQRDSWNPSDDEGIFGKILNDCVDYDFNSKTNESSYDEEEIQRDFRFAVMRRIREILLRTSYNKSPKMTKVYKSFTKICDAVKYNRTSRMPQESMDAFFESALKILDYHHNCTKENSILDKENEVHRKNIYSLIVLMEKKYGKKDS